MKFPHAAKGVSKIFSAEILSLIAVIICGIATVVLSIVLSSGEADNTSHEPFFIALGIVMIIAAILLLVGGIINIIGYFQAAMDEDGFKKAIYCTILGIIFSVIASVLVGKTGFLGWLCTTLNVLSEVMQLLVIFFSIGGLMNLSAKCHRQDMVADGSFLLKLVGWICILYAVILILTRVFRENAFNKTLVIIFTTIAMILAVIQYILYLSYLSRAKIMLSESLG